MPTACLTSIEATQTPKSFSHSAPAAAISLALLLSSNPKSLNPFPAFLHLLNYHHQSIQQYSRATTITFAQCALDEDTSCLALTEKNLSTPILFGISFVTFRIRVSMFHLSKPRYLLPDAVLIFCTALHGSALKGSEEN